MNHTINTPATVRELGDMAAKLGVQPSELLEMLGPIPMPPAGYTLAPGCSEVWIGAEIIKSRWIIMQAWNAVTNVHSVELWAADHESPRYANLSPAQAMELAADLTAASASIAAISSQA